MKKYFVVGLPRTGTTSVCVAALAFGYRTAHTAYTTRALVDAQCIADTPVFCDYPALLTLFPKSEVILLNRNMELWLPSIKRLLSRMSKNLFTQTGGFNDTIKRSYLTVFDGLNENNLNDDDYLRRCYDNHQTSVRNYCEEQGVTLHEVDIETLCLNKLSIIMPPLVDLTLSAFPHVNMQGKVTAWNDIRHELKIESTNLGKVDPDLSLYKNLRSNLCLN